MSLKSLVYLSEDKLLELQRNVSVNLGRYSLSGFEDLKGDNGWSIESMGVRADFDALRALNGKEHTAEADAASSTIVYAALNGMTPALASEERVWTRLTHIECIDYCRNRWLTCLDGQKLEKAILKHIFAPGRTGVRDDNALSRLWWNMHIASIVSPDDPKSVLSLIMKRADIRMQLVERPRTTSRKPLIRGVVRAMARDPWVISSEESFRKFMKVLNRDGGGVLFESLRDVDVDSLMDACSDRARALPTNS